MLNDSLPAGRRTQSQALEPNPRLASSTSGVLWGPSPSHSRTHQHFSGPEGGLCLPELVFYEEDNAHVNKAGVAVPGQERVCSVCSGHACLRPWKRGLEGGSSKQRRQRAGGSSTYGMEGLSSEAGVAEEALGGHGGRTAVVPEASGRLWEGLGDII